MEEQKKTSSGFGIASMICGILSILMPLMPYVSIPIGIAAIVFYGLQKPKTGMATAGLITGIIGIVVGLPLLFLFLIGMALFGA